MLITESVSDVLPVALATAKRHLGVTVDERDHEIETSIKAASGYLGTRTGRAWITTGYRLVLEEFPEGIVLPRPPLIGVDVVQYYDTDSVLQTMDRDDWQVIIGGNLPATLRPAPGICWPTAEIDREDAVQIRYRAGYGETPEDMPAEFTQACLLLIRHWYDNPSAVITGSISKEVELSVASLVRSLGTGFYANV